MFLPVIGEREHLHARGRPWRAVPITALIAAQNTTPSHEPRSPDRRRGRGEGPARRRRAARSVGRSAERAFCAVILGSSLLFFSLSIFFFLSPLFFYLLHSLFSSKGTPDNGLPRGAITASRSRLETGKQASRQALGHPHYRTRWRARALGHKRQGTAAAVAWWHCDGEVPRQH